MNAGGRGRRAVGPGARSQPSLRQAQLSCGSTESEGRKVDRGSRSHVTTVTRPLTRSVGSGRVSVEKRLRSHNPALRPGSRATVSNGERRRGCGLRAARFRPRRRGWAESTGKMEAMRDGNDLPAKSGVFDGSGLRGCGCRSRRRMESGKESALGVPGPVIARNGLLRAS